MNREQRVSFDRLFQLNAPYEMYGNTSQDGGRVKFESGFKLKSSKFVSVFFPGCFAFRNSWSRDVLLKNTLI